MEKLFTTEVERKSDRFRRWQEMTEDRIAPLVQSCLNEDSFEATISAASSGSMNLTEMSFADLRVEATRKTARHEKNRPDIFFACVMLDGSVDFEQANRSAKSSVGDLYICDTGMPWVLNYRGKTKILSLELPRSRLENILGSSQSFTGLTVDRTLPTTILARSFMRNLRRVGHRLAPDAADRMTSIATDLIVASIAERMAKETPRDLAATVTVQRAKAYIENNFGDPDLDPIQVAASVKVSIRYLQQLFSEHGRSISGWIWQRRLEEAAQRLRDPTNMHVALGTIAYSCGFVSQAHFSRRFKERFELSPGDYRHGALMSNV